MSRRTRDESGAIAIVFAITSIVLMIIAGLVVDLGFARDVKRQSQNAADASALAAGNALYQVTPPAGCLVAPEPCFSAAVSEAKGYALDNFDVPDSAWDGCQDPAHLAHMPDIGNECISFNAAVKPTVVRVRIPTRDVQTGVGAITGISTISISAGAAAAINPGRLIKCGLCVIGNGPHNVANGDVFVSGSSIHFNGDVITGPNGEVDATGHSITVENTATGVFDPVAESGAGRIEDPLSTLAVPGISGLPGGKAQPCQESGAPQGPGVYGAVSLRNGNCTLQPGLYVITGTWALDNNTKLMGAGVTLYFTCGSSTAPLACASGGGLGGMFNMSNGQAVMQAGAPGFENVVILYDRNNRQPIYLQGNGASDLTGTVYALGSLLYANGNACNTIRNGSIVVDSLYLNGQPNCLNLANGVERTWQLPPGQLHLDQ